MANKTEQQAQDKVAAQIAETVGRIKNRIVVFSGKGGVGKTTIAVNLAYALVNQGKTVGLLDADITGPNVPQMVGLKVAAQTEGGRIIPHEKDGVKFVSLASMIPPGIPIIWRGPLRSKAIDQLIGEVNWGDLDVLIADLPPGTGDEVLTITQRTAPQLAIVVTTPQEVSLIDARRAANMAKKMEVPKIGMVENMSGLICPHCGERIDLFGRGGGARITTELEVDFLGEVPIDPKAREGGDTGTPIVLTNPDAQISKAFFAIAAKVQEVFVEATP